MFNGKIHYKWQFSIAMLNYQRVCGWPQLAKLVKQVDNSGWSRNYASFCIVWWDERSKNWGGPAWNRARKHALRLSISMNHLNVLGITGGAWSRLELSGQTKSNLANTVGASIAHVSRRKTGKTKAHWKTASIWNEDVLTYLNYPPAHV